MKKIFLVFLTLTVLAVGKMSAQSFTGRWMADDSFTEMFQSLMEEGIEAKLGLFITQKEITGQLFLRKNSDDLSLDMEVTVPGTYTKVDNKVKTTFDITKFDLKVTDIRSDNPDVKGEMAIDETREVFLKIISEMTKEELGDSMKTLGEAISVLFGEFTIQQLTDKKLTVLIEEDDGSETEIGFDRKY